MGAVVSRWKANPTMVELLQGIVKDIKDLEECRAKNQRLEKLWVGRLLLYSSVLYLITCISVYFWYLPEQWTGRIVMTLPLFLFPILDGSLKRDKVKEEFKEQQQKMYSSMVVGKKARNSQEPHTESTRR